jgi:hypothetical protein
MKSVQGHLASLASLTGGVALASMALGGLAFANEPNIPIKCTVEPKSAWVSESRILQVFESNRYAKVFLKISRGHCYEFYAIGKDNSVTEAYYDPVTTEMVQSTRMDADGKLQKFERSNAAAAR